MTHIDTCRLVSAARLANLLGVKAAWLREEAEAGRLPAVKAGATFLFAPDIVIDALERRARGTADSEIGGAR